MTYDRHYYRQRAIQRRRDPDRDAKNEAANAAVLERVSAALDQVPLIQQMNEAARGDPPSQPV